MRAAEPAALELKKFRRPLLMKVGAFEELLTMPAPRILNVTPGLIV
jgi:hypothetical protein